MSRPIPVPQPESDLYWQRAREHELWVRACNACGLRYFYPRDICPGCFSRDTTWLRCSGRGALYSFTIVHRAPTPAWRDVLPYVAAIVELEEGPRLPTALVGVEPDPAKIRVGMALEVTFEALTADIHLPKFRPV